MSLVTMFVSMWVTNTAACTMMVPINFAILRVFDSVSIPFHHIKAKLDHENHALAWMGRLGVIPRLHKTPASSSICALFCQVCDEGTRGPMGERG